MMVGIVSYYGGTAVACRSLFFKKKIDSYAVVTPTQGRSMRERLRNNRLQDPVMPISIRTAALPPPNTGQEGPSLSSVT